MMKKIVLTLGLLLMIASSLGLKEHTLETTISVQHEEGKIKEQHEWQA